MYADQLLRLSETTDQMLAEIVGSESHWAESRAARHALEERLLALVKLVHRLDETAGETQVALLEKGQRPDKKFNLVGQGCLALDFVLRALDNYVDTDDRVFLGLARNGAELVGSIRKTF